MNKGHGVTNRTFHPEILFLSDFDCVQSSIGVEGARQQCCLLAASMYKVTRTRTHPIPRAVRATGRHNNIEPHPKLFQLLFAMPVQLLYRAATSKAYQPEPESAALAGQHFIVVCLEDPKLYLTFGPSQRRLSYQHLAIDGNQINRMSAKPFRHVVRLSQ